MASANKMMARVGKLSVPAMLLAGALVLVLLSMLLSSVKALEVLKNWVVVAGAIGLLYLVVRDLFESRGRSHPIRLTLAAVLGAALLFVTLEEMRGVPQAYKWMGGVGGSSVQLFILLLLTAPMVLRALSLKVADIPPPRMLSSARV
jgi:hypothetical protein